MGTLSGGALAGLLVALLVVSTQQSNGAELANASTKMMPALVNPPTSQLASFR